MRRRDREVTSLDGILAILDKCDVLRLGLCADGKPYIVPLNFAYEAADGAVRIYLHCAAVGRKMDMIAANRNVCFEADCSYETQKADEACKWSAAYESVIGEGTVDIVTDTGEKTRALDALMRRYGFAGKPEYGEAAFAAVTALRINVETLSGKRNSPVS